MGAPVSWCACTADYPSIYIVLCYNPISTKIIEVFRQTHAAEIIVSLLTEFDPHRARQ